MTHTTQTAGRRLGRRARRALGLGLAVALALPACFASTNADAAICTSAHEAVRIWESDGPSDAALDRYRAEARSIGARAQEAENRRIRNLATTVQNGLDRIQDRDDVGAVPASRAIDDLTERCPIID